MFSNKTNLQKFLAKLSKEEREEYQRQYDEVVFGDRKTISLTLLIPFFRDASIKDLEKELTLKDWVKINHDAIQGLFECVIELTKRLDKLEEKTDE